MRAPDEIRADVATARGIGSPLSVPIPQYAPWVQAGHRLVTDAEPLLDEITALRIRIEKALLIIGEVGCYCPPETVPEELGDHTCMTGRIEAALTGIASRPPRIVETAPL